MDKDTRILLGASEGWGSFRRFPELTPLYGNNFTRHEISLGKEWNAYAPFIPFVPAYIARATPLIDLAYDYAGTGAAGLGSERFALTARAGLSLRFGSMDDAEAIIRLRAGVGAAYNILNFGKGIVASGDFSVNAGAQASAAFVYCLSQYLCLGPKVAVGGDASAGYSTFYASLGFEVNGKIGPQGRLDVGGKDGPPAEPRAVAVPPVAQSAKPEVPSISPPAAPQACPPTKCPPATVCPPVVAPISPPVTACPPPPPPVDCEKVRKPLIAQLDQCKAEIEQEKKACPDLKEKIKYYEANAPKCDDRVKWIDGVRYLTVVKPQWMVLFQNDRTELELLEQKFPLKPARAWGKGHPTLDAVIRKMHEWVNAIQQKGAAQPYTIGITIRGFANETGGTARNVELANGRAEVVLKYLTSAKNVRNYRGEIVKPLEVNGILKSITAVTYGADVDPKDKIRDVLLAGKDVHSLDDKQKLALEQDVQNPIWRMAMIEFKITRPDGKEISVDDFSKMIGIEGGFY